MALVDFFFNSLTQVAAIAYGSAWLVAPVVLGIIAWKTWVYYINAEFLKNLKWVLLEIRLPKEIRRSPLAAELMLTTFHQTGGTSDWYQKYWQGNVRNYFSLEIVSIEGKVHFFIRTQERFRNVVESYVYAQYPEAEISEAPDYVERVSYTKDERWGMWGVEFEHTKPDPYPIKTYVDYGADKIAKEEEKIDPITPTIELMGSMRKGEQLWLQIIIRAAISQYRLPGKWFKYGNWKDEAKEEIKKIKEEATDPISGKFSSTMLTPGQLDVIKALERNTDKLGFDVGIRTIYIAEKEVFDGSHISSLVNILKQYNSDNLNGFRQTRLTAVSFPWENYIGIPDLNPPYISLTGKRVMAKKIKLFNLYRLRSYFYGPNNRMPMVLSSEELATIYHFPGGVAETPSFARIEAKKSEPPVNLPV